MQYYWYQKLEVYFNGKDGYGRFSVWAEDDWEMSQPLNFDNITKFYNSLLIAWRKFSFRGKFGYGGKEEELEGYGYFQRVCVNLPTMPWFWPILMFPNGSVFSSFQPYYGPNALRKNNKITHPAWLKVRLNVASSAYYADNESKKVVYFTESFVRELPNKGDDVYFETVSRNKETGDYVHIISKSLGETGWDLEKYLFGAIHSLWDYNEHIVQVVEIKGRINGKKLDPGIADKIYGNTEYVWGMSV